MLKTSIKWTSVLIDNSSIGLGPWNTYCSRLIKINQYIQMSLNCRLYRYPAIWLSSTIKVHLKVLAKVQHFMELYHSTDQLLNVNLSQTLHNSYKPVLGGHPLLSRHLGRSRRCLHNRGFTVLISVLLKLINNSLRKYKGI